MNNTSITESNYDRGEIQSLNYLKVGKDFYKVLNFYNAIFPVIPYVFFIKT